MSCTGCANSTDGKPAGCKSNGFCSSSGCNKLDVFDWLEGVPLPGGQSPFDAVEVRFKSTRKSFYRNAHALSLMPGDLVTVEASSGHDVGMVSLAGELVRAQMQRKGGTTDSYELRKVIRKSSQDDIDTWHTARKREDETLMEARRVCKEARLDMKVSDVEYQGDGTRATFFYTSEQRIDFRDLLRKLADQFHVRVDMKQIGARQEAGRVGGIGSCGRELCCSTWLTDFRTVTTSAARYQQLALNPQKLAGQCGKLKCCLNYELDMYIEAIKSYPSANAKLKTKQGTGMHVKTDIFGEQMWYIFKKPGEPTAMAGFPVTKVREILAQNKEGVEPEVDLHMAEVRPVVKVEEQSTDYENVSDGAEDLTRFDKKIKTGGNKRNRDGKKRNAESRTPREGGQGPQQPRRDGRKREGGPAGERSARQGPRPEGGRPANGGERPAGDRPARAPRPEGGRPASGGERPAGDRPARQGPRPEGGSPNGGERPAGEGRSRDGRGRKRRGPRPEGPAQGGGGPKPSDA
ncbi:MAG: regulatory iron-sulfur-containing complex subunit RicT [Flavobacteriales bacterium]